MKKVKIHIVLLGTQLHISAIRKLSTYKSDLFFVESTSSIAALPNSDLYDWAYSKQVLSSLFTHNSYADITVGIIENKIEGNYFARRLTDKTGILTFYQVDAILKDANIDSFNYLLLTFYKIVTLYRLSDERIAEESSKFIHNETRGCIFDMVGNKYDLVHSASNANLCQQCEAYLAQRNLPSNYVSTLKKELKKIRKSKYDQLTDFVKRKPIITLVITALFSLILNIGACYIFEYLIK